MEDSRLEKARAYAYRLIDYRPRSEKELQSRLREKDFSQQIIDKVTSSFKEEGLIDDQRFARLWARMRSQTSPRGPSFIRMELLSKEVDKDIVEQAIKELKKDFDEEKIARELLKRRLRSVAGPDKRKIRMRLFGYLKRRGFSSEIIYKLLDEITLALPGNDEKDETY